MPAAQTDTLSYASGDGAYDFRQCKLCASDTASPLYKLKKTTVYACRICDFHFIDHLDDLSPATLAKGAQQLDSRAWNYIESRLPANERQQRKNLLLVKAQTRLSGAQCLDIGAGAGLFAHLLAKEGALVHGVEPQGVFRDFCQQRFNISLRSETLDSDYWQQGFSDFFDVVTLWDVFEHVNFPAELLQQAYAVTKPGGLLFLDTPRRDALAYRIAEWAYHLSNGAHTFLLESLYSPLPFRHKQIFTCRQLQQLVKQTGFSLRLLKAPRLGMRNKMVLVCCKPDQT